MRCYTATEPDVCVSTARPGRGLREPYDGDRECGVYTYRDWWERFHKMECFDMITCIFFSFEFWMYWGFEVLYHILVSNIANNYIPQLLSSQSVNMGTVPVHYHSLLWLDLDVVKADVQNKEKLMWFKKTG